MCNLGQLCKMSSLKMKQMRRCPFSVNSLLPWLHLIFLQLNLIHFPFHFNGPYKVGFRKGVHYISYFQIIGILLPKFGKLETKNKYCLLIFRISKLLSWLTSLFVCDIFMSILWLYHTFIHKIMKNNILEMCKI